MENTIEINSLVLSPALFGAFLLIASWLFSKPKYYSQSDNYLVLKAQAYHLACLWEDAPTSALKGQVCELAIPLMTPFACLWEDAPASALKGQVCELAIPLMTPFACLWEDAPASALKGQVYELAVPWEFPYATPISQNESIAIEEEEIIPEILVKPRAWWRVLGVSPYADSAKIDAAYKKLIRQWHPDLNKSKYATQMTACINVAYQEYKVWLQTSSEKKQQLKKTIQEKWKSWFSRV